MRLPREFFIPKGAVKVSDRQSDAIAFIYTNTDGKPCARVFFGKQSKPVVRAYYRTETQRNDAVKAAFASRQASGARKAEYKATRRASIPAYAVDDVLSTCWGYDQTNREFYQVVKVSGASVTARVIPLPGQFTGPELVRRPAGYGLKISSCQRANHHEFELVAGVKVYRAVSTSSYA